MAAYDDAMARFVVDSNTPRRFIVPLPGVPVAQTKPAPINTSSIGIFQPPETVIIDGIITEDDARASS